MGSFGSQKKTNQAAFLCICSNRIISATVFGRVPYFTSIFNLGSDKSLVGFFFICCEQGDSILIRRPSVRLALLVILEQCVLISPCVR